ncbi:hypothetical protein EUGRSUZ_H04414 [Eucalyptus grandis]|uniref:Uncharacterized protein n=2 Tax=Eucalyptus grandis TaxID=71139 RepID=A0ACC3JWH5_EUCGR|nr:hypothetical protein EUGRSUZ_H04414 [Eucalyptus grandis]
MRNLSFQLRTNTISKPKRDLSCYKRYHPSLTYFSFTYSATEFNIFESPIARRNGRHSTLAPVNCHA